MDGKACCCPALAAAEAVVQVLPGRSIADASEMALL